jgi:hypothetical protein
MSPNRIAALTSASLCLTILACVGGGGSGLFGVEFVDEDFDRPSPPLELRGALRLECEEPPQQHYQTEAALGRALCLCGDLEGVGQGLRTRSFSRTYGQDGGLAHVGINGRMEVVGNPNVGGNLDVAGGLEGVGDLTIQGDLISGKTVEVVGDWAILGDAWIDGDLETVGGFHVMEDLYVTGEVEAVGDLDFDQARRGFDYSGPPCGCADSQIIDVAAQVRARRDQNDNARLPEGIGAQSLTFTAGEYYIGDPGDFVGARQITIQGRVKLYIEGDIKTVGSVDIDLAPGAELELWLAGRLETVGNLGFASEDDARARAFKLFMGGNGSSIVQVGSASFYGSIYAPRVDIEYVGDLTVYGSIFANNIEGTGSLDILYDTDVSAPDPCADATPDPVGDDRCDDDADCANGEVCDPVSHACGPEQECERDDQCPGNGHCLQGECVTF